MFFSIILISITLPMFNTNFKVVSSPKANYIFFLHLTVPTTDSVRMQFAQLMIAELRNIGIDAEAHFVSSDVFLSKTNNISGSFDEGGYDICLTDMSIGKMDPGFSLEYYYHEDSLPPTGRNIMYWADDPQYLSYRATESTKMLEAINAESNQTKEKEMLIEWQKIWYDVMPNVIAYYDGDFEGLFFNPQFETKTTLSTRDHPLNRKGVRHAISHVVPPVDIINYLLDGVAHVAYSPIPENSWAAISESELLTYKKTVTGNDGSKPELRALTAYDEYSPSRAMEWLASEGYDMRPWGGPAPGVDTIPPSVAITSPKNKTYTEGIFPVVLSGDAWYYWYYIRDVDVKNQSWVDRVSRSLDNGIYTLHAYGNDSAGNEAHQTVTFTIEGPSKTSSWSILCSFFLIMVVLSKRKRKRKDL